MDHTETCVHIGGEGLAANFVTIYVRHRTHPTCTDYWDGNWISVGIDLHAGCFYGNFSACLRSEELYRLLQELIALYDLPEGTAKFETTEEQLALTLIRNRRGHIRVEGTARDDAGIGNLIEFHFDIDQTFLPKIIHDLNSVLARFPVIGKHVE